MASYEEAQRKWRASQPDEPPEPAEVILTPGQWLMRASSPADLLLGELLTTTSRVLLTADTGLGKTMIGLASAAAAALGVNFLHWTGSGVPKRVLYVDGEMPEDLIKERLAEVCSWFGVEAEAFDGLLYVLSTADVDLPPLDTEDGRRWLDRFIEKLGGVDLLTLDNLQALTSGSLKDSESWATMKTWSTGLSVRRIGQFWLHHTGLDTSRSYGDKTREWGMDTVIVGEKVEDTVGADVAMALRFPKCRRRKPANRENFESVQVILRDGVWTETRGPAVKRGRPSRPSGANQRIVYDAALKVIAGGSTPIPEHLKPVIPAGHSVAHEDTVRAETFQRLTVDSRHRSTALMQAINALVAGNWLEKNGPWIWLPRRRPSV